jgi:hypothetical protein
MFLSLKRHYRLGYILFQLFLTIGCSNALTQLVIMVVRARLELV